MRDGTIIKDDAAVGGKSLPRGHAARERRAGYGIGSKSLSRGYMKRQRRATASKARGQASLEGRHDRGEKGNGTKHTVWGGILIFACLIHSTVDRASLSRRSVVPTPNRNTPNTSSLTTLLSYIAKTLLLLLPPCCGAVLGL